MDEIGYSFITQEKLKDYCKKNLINLNLWVYDHTLTQDKILEIINYCSLGDYDDSLELVEEVFRFRSNTLMFYSRSQEFLEVFFEDLLHSCAKVFGEVQEQ